MKQALFEPDKMTPAANDAWKLINYIRFVSIEDISNIFPDDNYIISKAKKLHEYYNEHSSPFFSSELAWLELINNTLDSEHLNRLTEYILEEYV